MLYGHLRLLNLKAGNLGRPVVQFILRVFIAEHQENETRFPSPHRAPDRIRKAAFRRGRHPRAMGAPGHFWSGAGGSGSSEGEAGWGVGA